MNMCKNESGSLGKLATKAGCRRRDSSRNYLLQKLGNERTNECGVVAKAGLAFAGRVSRSRQR